LEISNEARDVQKKECGRRGRERWREKYIL
jgi:hypothetical protein